MKVFRRLRGRPEATVLSTDWKTNARDAAFLAELVKGTVRFQGRYDQLVRRLSRRGQLPADRAVLAVLRLGLHQLIDCAGVPPYAAVHTTVTLCRQRGAARQAPFVNAVLQNVARRLAAGAAPAGAETVAAAAAAAAAGEAEAGGVAATRAEARPKSKLAGRPSPPAISASSSSSTPDPRPTTPSSAWCAASGTSRAGRRPLSA